MIQEINLLKCVLLQWKIHFAIGLMVLNSKKSLLRVALECCQTIPVFFISDDWIFLKYTNYFALDIGFSYYREVRFHRARIFNKRYI